MIRLILIVASIIVLYSCGSHKDVVTIENESDNVDSVEYMLIVDEVDFDSWMVTNSKRIWYYSHEYYKAWNKIYVNEFNFRVLKGADHLWGDHWYLLQPLKFQKQIPFLKVKNDPMIYQAIIKSLFC